MFKKKEKYIFESAKRVIIQLELVNDKKQKPKLVKAIISLIRVQRHF